MYTSGSTALNDAIVSDSPKGRPRIRFYTFHSGGSSIAYEIFPDELRYFRHEIRSCADNSFDIGGVCASCVTMTFDFYKIHGDVDNTRADFFYATARLNSTLHNTRPSSVRFFLDYVYTLPDGSEESVPYGWYWLHSIKENDDMTSIDVVAYDCLRRDGTASVKLTHNHISKMIMEGTGALGYDPDVRRTTDFSVNIYSEHGAINGYTVESAINIIGWVPFNTDGKWVERLEEDGVQYNSQYYYDHAYIWGYFALVRGGFAVAKRSTDVTVDSRVVSIKKYTSSVSGRPVRVIDQSRIFDLNLDRMYYHVKSVNVKYKSASFKNKVYEATENTSPPDILVTDNAVNSNGTTDTKYFEHHMGVTLEHESDLVTSDSWAQRPTTYLSGVCFKPGEVRMVGDPRIDAGDLIAVEYTKQSKKTKDLMYAHSIYHEYDGGLITTIECFAPEDKEE